MKVKQQSVYEVVFSVLCPGVWPQDGRTQSRRGGGCPEGHPTDSGDEGGEGSSRQVQSQSPGEQR